MSGQQTKADLPRARKQYPSTELDEAGWMAFFDTPAGFSAMGQILGDIYDAVKTEEEKAAGIRSMGRRPQRQASLSEVYAVVFPQTYSFDPFPESLIKLMNGRSQGWLAARVPTDQGTVSRWISGDRKPDLFCMEQIARACKVDPAYFMEWRAEYMAQCVQTVFLRKPNLGLTALQNLRGGISNALDAANDGLADLLDPDN